VALTHHESGHHLTDAQPRTADDTAPAALTQHDGEGMLAIAAYAPLL